MENDKQYFDVIIIGGGPAGVATALTLKARGINHCLVEANTNPIAKAGEAIPPNAQPLLRQLGINTLLNDQTHLPYYGNKSCWGDNVLRQEEFISEVHGHGYLLNRQYFEEQLQSIVKLQSDCFFGYRLKQVFETTDGVEVLIADGERSLTIKGKFIVDASGRKASACRYLGVSKVNHDDQFALTLTAKPRVHVMNEILIEATENGWWYAAPGTDGQMTLMFFTLKSIIPIQAQQFSFLQNEFRTTQHLQKLISINETDIRVMPAGTSSLSIPFGKNWLAVGGAAYAYDPISSYGITSALAGGFYAGHALSDHLSGKVDALNAYRYVMENGFQAYLEKLKTHYAFETRWPESEFWKLRLALQKT